MIKKRNLIRVLGFTMMTYPIVIYVVARKYQWNDWPVEVKQQII